MTISKQVLIQATKSNYVLHRLRNEYPSSHIAHRIAKFFLSHPVFLHGIVLNCVEDKNGNISKDCLKDKIESFEVPRKFKECSREFKASIAGIICQMIDPQYCGPDFWRNKNCESMCTSEHKKKFLRLRKINSKLRVLNQQVINGMVR